MTQEEIQQIFDDLSVVTPTYDSISFKGSNINYLTNKRNDRVDNKDKKPYIVFLHDSGKHSSDFIEYFKDPDFSNNFHLIAIDRPGFGYSHPLSDVNDEYQTTPPEPEIDTTNHVFNNMALVDDILDNENEHLNGVSVIAHGDACLYAVGAYTHMNLPLNQIHLFSPQLTHINKVNLLLKKISVSQFISWSLPNAFVNKNKEIILNNEKTLNDMDYYFGNVRSIEKGYREESHLLYKDYRALRFYLNKGSYGYDYSNNKEAVDEIRIDDSFLAKDLLDFGYNDIYQNPSETMKHLKSD